MSFAWSYSSISCLEQCPQAFYRRYVLKQKESSPALEKGNAVHKAIEGYLKTGGVAEVPGITLIEAVKRQAEGKKLCVELKMGLNGQLEPVGFFDDNVWGRGAADVIIIDYPRAFLADWKTGKVREKPTQLAVMSLFIFKHFPKVNVVTSCNVWLEHNKLGTVYTFNREQEAALWAAVMPKIQAAEKFIENPPAAMPACQCGYCTRRAY